MTGLRRHVIAVVAALFALAVGIAIGGGPLSYVPDQAADSPSTAPDETDADSDTPTTSPNDNFATVFAASVAPLVYDGALLGHPTAILAMPGADPDVVDAMAIHVKAAGGGLTGVFELEDAVVDLGETSLIDTLGSQLMTQLDTEYNDDRVDPTASTYVRFGQLVALAISTPVKRGLRAEARELTIRTSLATAGLLTSPDGARLAPLVIAILPPDDADDDNRLATASVFRGITIGLGDNPAGIVMMGDTASGASGVLAELRDDDQVTATVSTADGSDTGVGQVTAMLALIKTLDNIVGSYGASGADGAVPLS